MEQRYIPGDLIMTNGMSGGTAKDVIYRVVSSDPSRIFMLDEETDINIFIIMLYE